MTYVTKILFATMGWASTFALMQAAESFDDEYKHAALAFFQARELYSHLQPNPGCGLLESDDWRDWPSEFTVGFAVVRPAFFVVAS